MTVEEQEASDQDLTIIKCLKDFRVEVWEWTKMDLSAEVIAMSSVDVREIRLHSSGNQAVLRGWCAPEGFADRTRFPKVSSDAPASPMHRERDQNADICPSLLPSLYRFMRYVW